MRGTPLLAALALLLVAPLAQAQLGPHVRVPEADVAPQVDGVLGEDEWGQARVLALEFSLPMGRPPSGDEAEPCLPEEIPRSLPLNVSWMRVGEKLYVSLVVPPWCVKDGQARPWNSMELLVDSPDGQPRNVTILLDGEPEGSEILAYHPVRGLPYNHPYSGILGTGFAARTHAGSTTYELALPAADTLPSRMSLGVRNMTHVLWFADPFEKEGWIGLDPERVPPPTPVSPATPTPPDATPPSAQGNGTPGPEAALLVAAAGIAALSSLAWVRMRARRR